MKICLVAEGCYPYVVGGVSSWLQMLITGLSEYEFELYTIAVDESQRGDFKYAIPPNVTAIHEHFLMGGGKHGRNVKTRLPRWQAAGLARLVMAAEDIPWRAVYETVHSGSFNAQDYLTGYDFFDAAKARYEEENVSIPFSDYLWTLRSMYAPLLLILGGDIPRADLYNAVSAGYAGVVGALGSALYGKPFVLSEHGIYTREREEELIRSKWTEGYCKEMWIKQFYSLSSFAYQQAEVMVSLFEKNADIQQELGCPREKIYIVPNGVDAAEYEGVELQRPPDGFINIGAVIRVTPVKDIKTMIMAFNVVRQRVPETRFFILGPCDEDPEYYEECVELVRSLGLEEVLEMPGRVNVREYLPKMDIMVLTSISEGQPLAILEGMLFHKPWVATNVGSCSQLLYGTGGEDSGDAGIITPVMDVQQIAAAIIRMSENERMRLDMGEAGYNRATRFYRRSDMFASYREIYDSLGGIQWQESALN